MTSLYYISSTDPEDYGTVKYSITPIVCQPVQVRITGIQYTAHFSITTEDDYIELDYNDKYYFKECGYYLVNQVAYNLQNVMENKVNVVLNDRGLLEYSSEEYEEITGASHRAKLLMGLYHTDFPINIKETYTTKSIPLTSFGNILYLQTNIPSIIGLGDKNKEEYRSICYKGSDYLYPGIPVNSRTPGPIVITKSDALSDLKFQLVDFQQVPVILHSPLYITFEVYYNIQPTPMLPPQSFTTTQNHPQ